MKKTKIKSKISFTVSDLRIWGFVLLAIGYAGRIFLQSGVLGYASGSAKELLTAFSETDSVLSLVNLAMVIEGIGACAGPIFAFLLVKGFCNTSSVPLYLARLLVVAMLCEVPYDLAFSGAVAELGSQNPVFGLVIGLLLMVFFSNLPSKKVFNSVIKFLLTCSAALWAALLGIDDGPFLAIMVGVIWLFRDKLVYRDIAAAGAAIVSGLIAPYYLLSPLIFFVIHRYNGYQGRYKKLICYGAYPLLLIACTAAAWIYVW